jgi:hypothetical protein
MALDPLQHQGFFGAAFVQVLVAHRTSSGILTSGYAQNMPKQVQVNVPNWGVQKPDPRWVVWRAAARHTDPAWLIANSCPA